jgi:DNA-binding NarL/FixJ family response regulator
VKPNGSSPSLVRVAVVEDHSLVLSALMTHIEASHSPLRVVATARTCAEFVSGWAGWGADLALVDIELSDGSGIDAASTVLEADPDATIVFYSGETQLPVVRRALDIGARGFLSKVSDEGELVPALMKAVSGRMAFDSETAMIAVEAYQADAAGSGPALSPRERQVLQLLGQDNTLEAVARRLGVAESTVKTTARRARTKLEVSSTTAAVALAVQRGLIRIDSEPSDR